MLSPNTRSLYTEALCPPPGYIFDQAIATTFTLDPSLALSLPIHLALAERKTPEETELLKLLESLRRLSGRFNLYVDQTGMKVPISARGNVLFGLLETMVTPVKAPRGGVFHPKIWIIRFLQPDMDEPALLRMLVLSRNITYDNSWDISLRLEGKTGTRNITENNPVAEFLKRLPSFCPQGLSRRQKQQLDLFSGEIRKTEWELPEGFETISFDVLGIQNKPWSPPKSKRMAVVTPFLAEGALAWLGKRTDKIEAVISRPEEIDKLQKETVKLAEKWYTLDDAAGSEDGEETDPQNLPGLHAKIYLIEKGWWTKLYLGSANATNAALLENRNIEILVELAGKTSRVKGIDALLSDEEGLGKVLSPFEPEESVEPQDEEILKDQKLLEATKRALAEAGLGITCKPGENEWILLLRSRQPILLEGISRIKAWPITMSEGNASDVMSLADSGEAVLRGVSTVSVTGLIAFEFTTVKKNLTSRMVLSLPIKNLPHNREDEIYKLVVNNKDGFLRYLLLLLGDYEGGLFSDIKKTYCTNGFNNSGNSALESIPILEELVRAYSRNQEKLKDVENVIRRLTRDKTTDTVIPQEFLNLWEVFRQAIGEVKK